MKAEAEVSSLSAWMENRRLGAEVGCVHGCREARASLHVLGAGLETTLDAKVKKAPKRSLRVRFVQGTVSAMSTVSSNFKSHLQMNHRGAQRFALSRLKVTILMQVSLRL